MTTKEKDHPQDTIKDDEWKYYREFFLDRNGRKQELFLKIMGQKVVRQESWRIMKHLKGSLNNVPNENKPAI